jgi:hypothetical protein
VIALAVLEVLASGFIFISFAIETLIMTGLVALFPAAIMAPAHRPCSQGYRWCRNAFSKAKSGARRVTHDLND